MGFQGRLHIWVEYGLIFCTREVCSNVTIHERICSYVKSVLISCKDEFDMDAERGSELLIGKPFVVYDESKSIQDEILYYPVAESDSNKVVAVISLMNTSVGWQYCIDSDWADELNQWNYMDSKEDFIFYYKDGSLVAETSNSENQKSKNILKSQDLDHKSFENKKQIVKAKMRNWRKIDVEENRKSKSVLKYTPTVTDELGYFYCNMPEAQGQGNNGICWAASVATVVNYRTGTSYTAKNVADKMGIGYNEL